MSTAAQVIWRQMDRSGSTLLLGLEPVPDDEFFAGNANGFSAAWVTGHLACVADLFSSWHDPHPGLLFERAFHQVFNDTGLTEPGPASKAASVCPDRFSKALLLHRFREGMTKALRVLHAFDLSDWDAPAPAAVPVSMLTGGAVWEILAAHTYWHCGELAGSMPLFFGTYTLNIAPHHLYVAPGVNGREL
jgi:hypothetical protein